MTNGMQDPDSVNVRVVRLMVDADHNRRIGPFVARDSSGKGVEIGFAWDTVRGLLTPAGRAIMQRCYLTKEFEEQIEATLTFTLEDARIILRGLQEALGADQS